MIIYSFDLYNIITSNVKIEKINHISNYVQELGLRSLHHVDFVDIVGKETCFYLTGETSNKTRFSTMTLCKVFPYLC